MQGLLCRDVARPEGGRGGGRLVIHRYWGAMAGF